MQYDKKASYTPEFRNCVDKTRSYIMRQLLYSDNCMENMSISKMRKYINILLFITCAIEVEETTTLYTTSTSTTTSASIPYIPPGNLLNIELIYIQLIN
jgi:hypothetical protein